MIRSILVPLDGSEFGEQALPVATATARRTGATLRLVHVHVFMATLPYAGATPIEAEFERRMRADEAAYLERLASRLARTHGLAVDRAVIDGPVVIALDRYVKDTGTDLVVMTTHGRGGFNRAWLGSVADGLVRRCHRPILLIRPQPPPSQPSREPGFHRVLVPLDGSELAEQVLPASLALAGPNGARFLLLRVVPPAGAFDAAIARYATYTDHAAVQQRLDEADEYLGRVADRLREQGVVAATRTIVHDRPAVAILEEAAAQGVELIAMATHGRGGVRRMVLGSVADKVLRSAPLPLLLLRPRAC